MSGANPDSFLSGADVPARPDEGTPSPEVGQGGAREHLGTILATAFFLLLVPLLLVSMYFGQGSALEAEAVWAEVFEATELPGGLEFAGASQLATGDRLVVVAHPSSESEGPSAPDEPDEAAPSSAVPEQLTLVLYRDPEAVTDGMRPPAGSFDSGDRRDRRRGGGGGGPSPDRGKGDYDRVAIESGVLEWGPWSATFVHERAWERPKSESGEGGPGGGQGGGMSLAHREGPGRDTLRVNLSNGRHLCILYASWPLGVEAKPAWMSSLLAELRYRPAPPAAATSSAR